MKDYYDTDDNEELCNYDEYTIPEIFNKMKEYTNNKINKKYKNITTNLIPVDIDDNILKVSVLKVEYSNLDGSKDITKYYTLRQLAYVLAHKSSDGKPLTTLDTIDVKRIPHSTTRCVLDGITMTYSDSDAPLTVITK